VIERLPTLWPLRRHPRSAVLSRYLDGDLDAEDRHALDAHIRDCPRCRRELGLLAVTLEGLGSLEPDSPPRLADSIIAALRAEAAPEIATLKRTPDAAGTRVLTVIPGSGPLPGGDPIAIRWPREARAALRWCLQRPQLRLTLPISVVAGVVLSMVNMGGMLMHGRIDLGVCMSCAIDVLVPFIALNLGLLMLLRLPGRRRL
jgi:anti-sigma factor RsiW